MKLRVIDNNPLPIKDPGNPPPITGLLLVPTYSLIY